MRRALRWIRRVLLALVALAVVAVIAALIVVHTDWGRDLMRREVEAALAGSFPGGARVGKLEGSVFGTVTIRDLELDDATHQPEVTIATARLELGLWSLLRKTVRLERIELDDVVVTLRPQPPSPPSPPSATGGGGTSWSIELDGLVVHRARVLRDGEELRDLELVAAARLPAGGARVALADVHGRWRDHALAATALIGFDGDVLRVPIASVVADRAHAIAVGVSLSDVTDVEGLISAAVPVELARALGVDVADDVALVATARRGGVAEVHATMRATRLDAFVRTEVAARRLRGVAVFDDPDRGLGVAAVELDAAHVRGIVVGHLEDPAASVVAAIDGTPRGGTVTGHVRTLAGRATTYADVSRTVTATGETWKVTRSRVFARAQQLGALTGALTADVRATGRLWPRPELHVVGTLDGRRLTYGAITVDDLHLVADAHGTPTHATGAGTLDVARLANAGAPIGSAHVGWRAEGGPETPIAIALLDHLITPSGGAAWSGTGGAVTIGARQLELRGLQSASGAGRLAARATLTRASGDLVAHLEARDVALAAVQPGTPGRIGGTFDVARRGGRWSGTGRADGHDLVASPTLPPFDGAAVLELRGRRVIADVTAIGPLGRGALAVEVEGPVDVTDGAAWRRVERGALRVATLTVAGVDARPWLGSGQLDGELELTRTDARGALRLRGVTTPLGELAGDVHLAPALDGAVTATLGARIDDLGDAAGEAHLGLPARPFDPAAWRALGRDALRAATLRTSEVAFDPALLGRLGVVAPYRGRGDLTVELGPGATRATVTARVLDLAGGVLALPLDLTTHATIDPRGLVADLDVRRGEVTLASGVVRAPLTLDRRYVLRDLPLRGTLCLPAHDPAGACTATTLAARDLLALLGRAEITAGTVVGAIELGGTVGTPTARATLTARDVSVPPTISGRKAATMSELTVAARWGGVSGELELTGREVDGGTLRLTATGRPDRLTTIVADLEAKRFDLGPLTALAPGALVGASGLLDASLEARGLDPDTGDLRGELHLREARLPVSATLGTLRRASLDVTIADHVATGALTARLSGGQVTGHGTVTLVGGAPTRADGTLTIRKVALVGPIEPVVSADVSAHLTNDGQQWTGDVAVTGGVVTIATTESDKLLPAGTPSDLTFVDAADPEPPATDELGAPTVPWLVAEVTIGPATIDGAEAQAVVAGHLTVSRGDDTEVDGELDVVRGDAELFGRRYQSDEGTIVFDGDIADPLLNLRLTHDFADVTLTANVGGRPSEIDLQLTSDPNIYTQGQLLGFFLGGEPGGDPSSASRDAAVGAGASVLSSTVGKRLTRVLPVKLDVLTYEAGTSTSSGAIRAGGWLSRKLFVAYRGHPEARPDENANEGEVEYYFLRNWILQGTAGDRGIGGADVVHRWRW